MDALKNALGANVLPFIGPYRLGNITSKENMQDKVLICNNFYSKSITKKNPRTPIPTIHEHTYLSTTILVSINTMFQEDIISTETKYHKKTSPKLFYSRQPTISTRTPKPLYPTMINQRHMHSDPMSGHFNKDATFKRTLNLYYWPMIYKDIFKYMLNFGNPFDRIEIDLYITVVINYLTKWPEARAIQVANAKTVAKFFGIKCPLLSPYYSQTNKLVKQFNRTLCEALAKIKILSYPTETITEENFKATLTAADNISNAQKQQKKRHDNCLSKQLMKFKIGDQVLLYCTKAEKQWSGKFNPKWDGLFYIHKALGNEAYKLQLEDRILKKVAHGNQLKIYHAKQKLSSSIFQLGIQISLIRPEDISQDLKPIIIIEINVEGKIAFGQEVKKKEAKNKKKLVGPNSLKQKSEHLTIPKNGKKNFFQLINLSQKTFNKEAIQQVEKFVGKNNLILHYKVAY
ncbi:hypothetical protein G9A89_008152 [Geosiphon pyriformis]|nr:hypothetical protein G9A89_008152 [Geosiphon pyriformis]